MRKLTTEDFWNRVDTKDSDECWMWKGAIWDRYGGFGRREYAHRASWRINRGNIPEGLEVLHKCDNPLCVNPNHLYLGTQVDNLRDAYNRNPNAPFGPVSKKLDANKIRLIRNLYNAEIYTQIELSRRYGVSDSYIWAIVNGRQGDHTLRKEGM